MKTHLIYKIVPSLCVVVASLSACGGGGGSSAETSTAAAPTPAASTAAATSSNTASGKTPTELSAEVSAQMAAVSTISPTMDWSSSLVKAVVGQINVTSGSSLGKVDVLVSTVDFIDPTTGSEQEKGLRGTTLHDSRIDDPSRASSAIDASGLNAQFLLHGINFREIDKLYIEVFSTTKGLVYSAVVPTNDVNKKTFAINVD